MALDHVTGVGPAAEAKQKTKNRGRDHGPATENIVEEIGTRRVAGEAEAEIAKGAAAETANVAEAATGIAEAGAVTGAPTGAEATSGPGPSPERGGEDLPQGSALGEAALGGTRLPPGRSPHLSRP